MDRYNLSEMREKARESCDWWLGFCTKIEYIILDQNNKKDDEPLGDPSMDYSRSFIFVASLLAFF